MGVINKGKAIDIRGRYWTEIFSYPGELDRILNCYSFFRNSKMKQKEPNKSLDRNLFRCAP